MSAGRPRRFGPEHTKPAASATVAGHSGGIRFFCAVCIFVPVFPLILGCKLSFLPVTKKGTFFCYQRKIRFLRGENILIFAAKKGTLKCGGNQDEKSRESGEKLCI